MVEGISNHWNQGSWLVNNEYKLNALRWRRRARLRWVGERADAQLLTWWGDCGVCLYTLKIGPHYCLSVILSASLLYCFAACVYECVHLRALRCVCEWGLLTSSTVTLWLLTTPISRMSGRRREGVWVHSERLWWACMCLWVDLCVWGSEPERALHANCCNPRTKVHERRQESLIFMRWLILYLCSVI